VQNYLGGLCLWFCTDWKTNIEQGRTYDMDDMTAAARSRADGSFDRYQELVAETEDVKKTFILFTYGCCGFN
jgi:hypothetical protein